MLNVRDHALELLLKVDALFPDASRWIKHKLWNNSAYAGDDCHAPHCLLGAFNYAHHGHAAYQGWPNQVEADAYARLLGFESKTECARWNNAEDRTFEDVKNRLAAAIQRQGGQPQTTGFPVLH